jgi:hypothetical protein
MYYNRDKLKAYAKLAYDYVHQEQFSWTTIANKFDKMIMSALGDDSRLSKPLS